MARILHRDVSLFNLLFTVLNNKKLLNDILQNLPGAQSECYTKATSVGQRFSEGGTHEETLCPQDLKRGLGSQQTIDDVV